MAVVLSRVIAAAAMTPPKSDFIIPISSQNAAQHSMLAPSSPAW
jgi:hypothetical protein